MSRSCQSDGPYPLQGLWRVAPVALLLVGVGITLNRPSYSEGVTYSESLQAAPISATSRRTEPAQRAEALKWVEEARQVHRGIRDYRCVLTARERVQGRLLPTQSMDVECRVGAFAVHLVWHASSPSAGQEVWFGEGLNSGKMRVRAAGYLGAMVGVVSVDPFSPTVRENSRHAITEAGLGTMLEQFVAPWETAPTEDVSIRTGTSHVNGLPCRTIEVCLKDRQQAEWQRGVLHLDQQSALPVRVEYHDAEGRLLEEATYQDVRLNVGLTDDHFRR